MRTSLLTLRRKKFDDDRRSFSLLSVKPVRHGGIIRGEEQGPDFGSLFELVGT